MSKEKSMQEMEKELERVRAENEALQKRLAPKALSMKVSDKGALSVYGLGRFPVTLYKEQWARILEESFVADMREFLRVNDKQLKAKGE